jgi:hypothetical protein
LSFSDEDNQKINSIGWNENGSNISTYFNKQNQRINSNSFKFSKTPLPAVSEKQYVPINSELIVKPVFQVSETQLGKYLNEEEPDVHLPDGPTSKDCLSYGKQPPNRCVNDSEYRKQSRLFHPDKNLGCVSFANAKFIKIKRCTQSRRSVGSQRRSVTLMIPRSRSSRVTSKIPPSVTSKIQPPIS